MKYLKKISISIGYVLTSFLLLTFIITLFNYFNIINDKIVSIFKIIIPIISLFIGGFYIGKKAQKKGFIEGLKLGFIFIILLLIFNFIILNNNFKLSYLLFYIILLFSAVLGSMIGINKNSNK